LDIIYTPWRYEYVSNVDKRPSCIFCDRVKENEDKKNFILHRGEKCFVILNLYPYTTGHLMIAPYEHLPSIEDLDAHTLAEMMELCKKSMKAIRAAFQPEGFNIGINISRVAGAGIVDHVHMHVVPRWAGDSNFMAVVASTRVLPCDLDQVYNALSKSF